MQAKRSGVDTPNTALNTNAAKAPRRLVFRYSDRIMSARLKRGGYLLMNSTVKKVWFYGRLTLLKKLAQRAGNKGSNIVGQGGRRLIARKGSVSFAGILRALLLYTLPLCVSLSGCASPRYYESLPAARSGILAYHDVSDPEATRAVLITRRLLASRPIPVENVFIITSNLKNPKTGNQFFTLEDNAGSLRCGDDSPLDGCIFVGMKLIQGLSDDALAGVLAHELGHLEKGHIGSDRVNTALGVARSAPQFCTPSQDPTATLIMCGIGLGISLVSFAVAAETAGMDRDIERETDQAAWDRLALSGYCAGRTMKTAFEELSKLTPEGGKSDLFSTHPSYSERWANADPSCGSLATAREPVKKQDYLAEKQKTIEEAREYYVKAAAQGNAEAQYNLGVLYANGNGGPQDYAIARGWYEKAAAQGYAGAQNNLGILYEHGWGVPQDYAMAQQWWEKAAAQGNAEAQFNLGLLYQDGWGVPQDYAMGRQWYEKAAAQGYAGAQYNLGLLYQNGWGVSQDYAAAREWYKKAAAQGDAGAQNNLGVLYQNGWGVPQDYATARGWYEKAATQGYAGAQNNLGVLYANGNGVPQDYAMARRWLEKAAAQGYAPAQNNLRRL